MVLNIDFLQRVNTVNRNFGTLGTSYRFWSVLGDYLSNTLTLGFLRRNKSSHILGHKTGCIYATTRHLMHTVHCESTYDTQETNDTPQHRDNLSYRPNKNTSTTNGSMQKPCGTSYKLGSVGRWINVWNSKKIPLRWLVQ